MGKGKARWSGESHPPQVGLGGAKGAAHVLCEEEIQ